MRQDYDKFIAQDAELLIVGPEDADAFRRYWSDHNLPFPGLPDPKHSVLKLYGYVHYGKSMSDIPSNEEILAALV